MQETHRHYATDGGSPDPDPEAAFVPETCIGFDIAADYAHFRRVGNNSAKPSYRVPPRPTIAGLLAGIMGMPRDSYYDLFSPARSALAVVPKQMPHTHMMAITTVNTKADDAIQYLPKEKHYTKSAEMLTPESYVKYSRQRDTYQMLVDPVYRVYVGLADQETHDELQDRLENSRYHYSPSLGLSECLAEIDAVDTHPVSSSSAERIDAASYDDSPVIPEPGVSIKRERAPLYMKADEGGRKTTAFGNITYSTGSDGLPVDESYAHSVGSHDVIFN